jgi:hypothetical protein
MRKIKFLLSALVVGALVALAGCSANGAEGNGWKGASNGSGEAGRGRSEIEMQSDSRRIDEGDFQPVSPVSLTKLEGTLAYDDAEWFLDIGDETIALHLGNRTYLDGLEIELEEGSDAVVFGIMEEDGLSVSRIATEDGEIVLRSDAGVPRWSGNGNRGSGQGTGQSGGRGTGKGAGGRVTQASSTEQIRL